jgi:YD repeat-containing protein
MAATHSYVITVGTTPVPDSTRALRRAARHGNVSARHARGVTVVHTASDTRTAGAHRSTGRRTAGTLSRRGVHRAGRRRAVDWDALQRSSSATRIGGRHRATRAELRARRSSRGVVLRAALPVLLVFAVTAVFISAWFGATGAVAFASVVHP